MSYLPDIYRRFERAFPNVHLADQELAKACYESGLSMRAPPVSSSSASRLERRRRVLFVRTLAGRWPRT
jgi:hypothetical protein